MRSLIDFQVFFAVEVDSCNPEKILCQNPRDLDCARAMRQAWEGNRKQPSYSPPVEVSHKEKATLTQKFLV